MTEQTRNLLISMASHMAYMQGQLEARHELDDPEDYYWYRESVLLRQKVTDALADEPAVPDGREPVSVVREPSDEDLLGIACQSIKPYDKIRPGEYEAETECVIEVYGSELVTFARAVLARWGTSNLKETRSSLGDAPAPVPVPVAEGDCPACEGVPKPGNQPCAVCGRSAPPAEGEVAELVECLRRICFDVAPCDADAITRAVLARWGRPAIEPVPVSERPWERNGWCDENGWCWGFDADDSDPYWIFDDPASCPCWTHLLPHYALPLPQGEGEP